LPNLCVQRIRNIAEGCGRDSERELARFMSIAAGSASEVEYQLLLACDLNYIQDETYREINQQVNDVKRMLNSFIQKLTAQIKKLQEMREGFVWLKEKL